MFIKCSWANDKEGAVFLHFRRVTFSIAYFGYFEFCPLSVNVIFGKLTIRTSLGYVLAQVQWDFNKVPSLY